MSNKYEKLIASDDGYHFHGVKGTTYKSIVLKCARNEKYMWKMFTFLSYAEPSSYEWKVRESKNRSLKAVRIGNSDSKALYCLNNLRLVRSISII